jgi:hypothetical protein
MATKRKMKRTKKPTKPSQGLGDDIEKITEATGIKKVVELFTPEGKDCGCEKRKEKLNKMFPKNKPNCFNQEQFEDWTSASKEIEETNTISAETQNKIIFYLRMILNMSVSANNCKSCSPSIWKRYISMLNDVASTYEQ